MDDNENPPAEANMWETLRGEPVRYGPGPDDHIAHSWAEKMLTQLAADNPRLFGRLLQSAALNEQR